MTTVEILVPLRIETRFAPPDAASGRSQWLVRLRVYPDEFSMERPPRPPSAAELDRLDEALAAPFRTPSVDAPAAFGALAAAVGAPRAVWLMRTVPRSAVGGIPRADRAGVTERDPEAWPVVQKPFGLPAELGVWWVPPGGPAFLASTMKLDRAAIAADLDLAPFGNPAAVASGELPRTWWTSFGRAVEVGLGVEIPIGPTISEPEAIVVAGIGDADPAGLIATHAAAGRLALLKPGTATNTVAGEPTGELGRDPAPWLKLVAADPAGQAGAAAVTRALTGGSQRLPILGGDIDPAGRGPGLVRALWPVLWGRSLRDVIGAGPMAAAVAGWAADHLAPEGPYPAIRVGEQPYGLLPATALAAWAADASDGEAGAPIRGWAQAWRRMAAAAAEAGGTALGASGERLLELLGEATPSRQWGVRPVAPLAVARALRAAAGMPTLPGSPWDAAAAGALAGEPGPADPVAPVGGLFPVNADADEFVEDRSVMELLVTADPGILLEWQEPLSLLGHLLREAMMLSRAAVGQAYQTLNAGDPVDPDAALPLWPPAGPLVNRIGDGTDDHVDDLEASGEPGAAEVAMRFRAAVDAAFAMIEAWEVDRQGTYAALYATLDTASWRVDPWITGLADCRLRELAARGAPFRLGAYGWVDRPRPYTGGAASPPPPGPTAAGLLHAPSYNQALVAALLRDAAVRHPGDERWRLNLTSSKVREAARLGERVRLGLHPYEALGLEVERLVGDWDQVRILRQAFPLADGQDERRCCDGARVLRAVLYAAEPLPAGLPAGLAATLRPLADVLDTYADLLVADGVHALVSGQGGTAHAAMEAAAGLGAPPELRAIRTPRQSTSVRVSAWALLPPGPTGDATAPAVAADPAFAALLDAELGPPAAWTWWVGKADGPVAVSLADRNLHAAELLDLSADALAAAIRGPLQGAVHSTGGAALLAKAQRLAELLGGGDANPPVPDSDGGRDDSAAPAAPLRQAMLDDLGARLGGLVARATLLLAWIEGTDVSDISGQAAIAAELAHWRLVASGPRPLLALRAALQARIAEAAAAPPTVNGRRAAIRAFVGNRRIPVLPVVARRLLPGLNPVAAGLDGHPQTDRDWLEIVAAVRPRLALLEARQLDPAATPWPAALATGDGSADPWTISGPVVLAYGPAANAGPTVALAGLDAWVDAVPSRSHTTAAAFGFNGPKARPPQAILIAVPPQIDHRMTPDELVETVLETRLLARARAARPVLERVPRVATPSPIVTATGFTSFLDHWND